MYGCASTRYESVLGQYRYRSIHSSSRYFMKVSGQIQDPAALAPEKKTRAPKELDVGGASEEVWTFFGGGAK